jgi:hypothetical protein
MKQSNWILGIGIIVAAILIAGTLLLKAKPKTDTNSPTISLSIPTANKSIKMIIIRPINEVTTQLFRFDK